MISDTIMSIVKRAKYGIAAALLGIAGWLVHDNGRDIERGECLKQENKALADKNKELADTQALLDQARERNAKLAAENLKLNDEVTANAAKQLEAARVADAALRRDAHGLRISAKACDSAGGMSTATGGAGVDHSAGPAGGIRLPAEIETNLYELAYQSNRTRIKRDECREWAIGLKRQRDEWEKAHKGGLEDGKANRLSDAGGD